MITKLIPEITVDAQMVHIPYEEMLRMVRSWSNETTINFVEAVRSETKSRRIKAEQDIPLPEIKTLDELNSLSDVDQSVLESQASLLPDISCTETKGKRLRIAKELNGPSDSHIGENNQGGNGDGDGVRLEWDNTPHPSLSSIIKETTMPGSTMLNTAFLRNSRSSSRVANHWTEEETDILIKGLNMFGKGRWSNIAALPGLVRTNVQIKDKYVNLLKHGRLIYDGSKYILHHIS